MFAIRSRGSLHGNERKWGVALVAPALGLYALFVIAPLIATFGLSFTNESLEDSSKFIGIENYADILSDAKVHRAILTTFLLLVEIVPAVLLLSFGLALLLNGETRKMYTARLLFFLPLVTSGAAIAAVFRYVFYRQGLINSLLGSVTPVDIPYLALPDTAPHALSLIIIWSLIPINIILYLGALQSIPTSHFDAARVDGAGPFALVRHIAWPAVRPTTLILLILDITAVTIGSFDIVNVLTQGGPRGSTTTVIYLLYEAGFKEFRIGYASAIGVLLLLAMVLVVSIQVRVQGRAS